MKKLFLQLAPLLLIFCSVLGIVDAGYLTWEKYQGVIPPCSGGFKCDTVLTSSWSSIGPVHVSLLGVFFYVGFLVLAALLVLDVQRLQLGSMSVPTRIVALAWGSVGLLTSIVLVSVMAFVLQAWCIYCLLSAVNSVILFVVSSWYARLYQEEDT